MSLLAAIPYDAFTFGPFEVPLLSDLVQSMFDVPLKIHSFGLFVAIGLLICFTMAARKGEQKLGLDGEEVQNFGIYLIAIGWMFSHFFNVIFYEPHLIKEDPLILFKFWGSISSYGGLFGGIIAAWIWRIKHREEDFTLWLDLAAWGLTFAWMFGRIGCASVHDDPGAETVFFLAISGWPDGATRHVLGLFEAMWWVVIVAAMLILDRKPRPKGFYIAVVPLMYAPARFSFDFLRVGPEQGGDLRYLTEILPGGGWTPAQFFSIGIFIAGIYFWNRMRNEPPLVWKQFDPAAAATTSAAEVAEDDEESDEEEAVDRKRQHRPKKKK